MPTLSTTLPVRFGSSVAGTLLPSGIAWDVVIGGIPFLAGQTVQDPQVRETAPFKKDQTDQSSEAGEQSLGGWWWRSQSSFHGGAGQTYLEAPQGVDQTISRIRFEESVNIDPWTVGVFKRLPDTTLKIASGSSGQRCAAGRMGTVDYVLHTAGATLSSLNIDAAGATTTTVIPWGGVGTILALATDGRRYWVADSTGIWSGPVDNSVAGAKVYTLAAPTSVVLAWVKQRLMACVDNAVYALVAVGLALPVALYTHPTPGWTWTAISEDPTAILIAGYAGGASGIVSFELSSAGVAPTLTAGAEIASMPPGELIRSLYLHAGSFLAIGTSRGLRIGTFDQFSSRLAYGPLSIATPAPVLCAAGRGDHIYCGGSRAINSNTESGLLRLDPGTQIDQAGRLAWATDLIGDAASAGDVGGVAATTGGRLAYCVDGYGLLLEGVGPGSARSAWLRTSRIRYSTNEPKLFKYATVSGTFASPGSIRVWASSAGLAETSVESWSGLVDPDRFALPAGPRQWMQLRFELLGAGAVTVTNYQVLALPASPRQRMLQYVLLCADRESDRNGQTINRAGWAWSRLRALEQIEEDGDELVVVEYLPGIGAVSRRCVLERVTFREPNRPTRTNGMVGNLLVVARTVS
jgi:hypothetical protein